MADSVPFSRVKSDARVEIDDEILYVVKGPLLAQHGAQSPVTPVHELMWTLDLNADRDDEMTAYCRCGWVFDYGDPDHDEAPAVLQRRAFVVHLQTFNDPAINDPAINDPASMVLESPPLSDPVTPWCETHDLPMCVTGEAREVCWLAWAYKQDYRFSIRASREGARIVALDSPPSDLPPLSSKPPRPSVP